MNDQMQALLDKFQIQQVLAAYARGVDRIDVGLLKSVYWEEAIDNHGSFYGNAHDFADYLGGRLPRHRATTHFLGRTYFAKFDGRQATTETNFVAWHAPRELGKDGYIVTGRYLDVFEKRGDEWRILQRDAVFDWSAEQAFRDKPLPDQLSGGRWPNDRSYKFPVTEPPP